MKVEVGHTYLFKGFKKLNGENDQARVTYTGYVSPWKIKIIYENNGYGFYVAQILSGGPRRRDLFWCRSSELHPLISAKTLEDFL